MLGNIGPTELLVIGLVLVVVFGSKRLSNIGKTLGETTRELKKAKNELEKVSQGTFDEPKGKKKD